MTPPVRVLRAVPAPHPAGPEPAPVDGAEVLDEIGAFVSRFNAFPHEHCAPMLALWYAHTHAAQHFYVTPRLILDSPEPGSGKTRALEVAQYLVKRPEMTLNASAAAIFRLVSFGPITLLFDEVDAIFNPKNGGTNEDLRALLNAGYKRTATIPRCVGDAKAMRVERFQVYAPVALAGLAGNMPDTITTRAITVHLRRRAPDETVEPFKECRVAAEAAPLREALAEWVDAVGGDQLTEAEPAMPDGVEDRAAEIWEPLLAVADAAGGHWPDTARAACTHFVGQSHDRAASFGTRLLADLRVLFTTAGTDRMRTPDILTALHGLEESPWGDLYGKPLDARRLARELARYGVTPGTFREGATTAKGYQTSGPTGLADAWRRYLPAPGTGPPAVLGNCGDNGNTAGQPVTATDRVTDVAVTPNPSVTPSPGPLPLLPQLPHPPAPRVADETRETR